MQTNPKILFKPITLEENIKIIQNFYFEEDKKSLQECLQELKPREKEILEMRFGLNDNEEFTYDGTSKKPSGTIKVDGDKVPVSELEVKYTGTGYNSAEAPKNAGTYTVTYRVKDDNPTYVGSVTYTFTIEKAQLDKVTLVKDTFEYTGSDITPTLNNVNSNIEVTGNTTAKNVSNYTITAKIKDKTNYE